MHFLEAGEIIKVARKKINEKMIWERWLVELPYMDESNFKSFEDYKRFVLELGRMANRTEEEKKADLEEARAKAKEARRRLNPNNDLHKIKPVSKNKKVKNNV